MWNTFFFSNAVVFGLLQLTFFNISESGTADCNSFGKWYINIIGKLCSIISIVSYNSHCFTFLESFVFSLNVVSNVSSVFWSHQSFYVWICLAKCILQQSMSDNNCINSGLPYWSTTWIYWHKILDIFVCTWFLIFCVSIN